MAAGRGWGWSPRQPPPPPLGVGRRGRGGGTTWWRSRLLPRGAQSHASSRVDGRISLGSTGYENKVGRNEIVPSHRFSQTDSTTSRNSRDDCKRSVNSSTFKVNTVSAILRASCNGAMEADIFVEIWVDSGIILYS
ncbi:unnamed protein product [Nezara viridula]|uniref:Uncharacterized protein n=1 Tax=Nezara viridula TaxID=85310 RepID=A0A9P0H0Q8_NEZVI|nr:unnamed protein product [Nezara viridula]